MVNIMDIVFVASECYLLIETMKSSRKAYQAYKAADTLIKSTDLNPTMANLKGFQQKIVNGKIQETECDTVPVNPKGKGWGPNGMHMISLTEILNKGFTTSNCYKFTAMFEGTKSTNPDNTATAWNDKFGVNAGGRENGISRYLVSQYSAPDPVPTWSFWTGSIQDIVYFYK